MCCKHWGPRRVSDRVQSLHALQSSLCCLCHGPSSRREDSRAAGDSQKNSFPLVHEQATFSVGMWKKENPKLTSQERRKRGCQGKTQQLRRTVGFALHSLLILLSQKKASPSSGQKGWEGTKPSLDWPHEMWSLQCCKRSRGDAGSRNRCESGAELIYNWRVCACFCSLGWAAWKVNW